VSVGTGFQSNFKNKTLTAADLVGLALTPHRRRKSKDGLAICGGRLWDDADALKGKNLTDDRIADVSVLIFEVDSGQSPLSATSELARLGLAYIVVSTHNNGLSIRDVPHDELLKHMSKRGREGAKPEPSDVTAYLLEHGRVTPALARSVHGDVELRSDKNGKPAWVFRTAPCPKFRIYVFLKTPFIVFKIGTIGRDTKLFSALYNRLADEWNILHDASCANVSRLQYLPSVRIDGDTPFSWFVPGAPYDYTKILERMRGALESRPAALIDSHTSGRGNSREPGGQRGRLILKTANLLRFCTTCSPYFAAEEFVSGLLEHRGESNSGGSCFKCPNEDGDISGRPHSDPGGTAFWVCNSWNRSDGGSGFILQCSTDGCRAHFDNDRIRFLDELCQTAGIADAVELLEYTSNRTEAQEAYDAWDRFQTNDDGRPHPNQHNIRIACRRLGVSIRYNEFDGRICLEGLDGFGPYLDDAAVLRLWLTIDREFRFKPTKDFFYDVLVDEARVHSYHPVRIFLDECQRQWDSINRVDTWLTTYLGAEDTAYIRAVGRLFLIAAVRRIRKPGCKFDEMPVLESEQGKGKSSALAILAYNPDWFTDTVSLNADSKKIIEQTRGKWIAEIAELVGGTKAEIESIKAFLSRQVDASRMAYGRMTEHVQRAFVCAGTTNSER
jgi:hypothetical protein